VAQINEGHGSLCFVVEGEESRKGTAESIEWEVLDLEDEIERYVEYEVLDSEYWGLRRSLILYLLNCYMNVEL